MGIIMTIELDKNQPKTITMGINVQGIDTNKLNFSFRIGISDNMCIGFRPKLIGSDTLEIHIPALGYKIKDLEPGRYTAKLEIDDGEQYYMKPWSGEILIKEVPYVSASMEENKKLDTNSVTINKIDQVNPYAKSTIKEEKKQTKPKKKMSKDDAVKFVQEARKRFKNEDPEVLGKFIKDKLNENGFNYNPKSKKHNTKNTVNEHRPQNRNDIIKYLQSKGLKNENTVNTLMEKLDRETGGDVDSMYDMARRMVDPNHHQQFENTSDIFNYFQQQSSYLANQGMSTQPSGNEGSNLMEQIQKAKVDLKNQLN